MHRHATEARTGHGLDAVIEILPGFVPRPDESGRNRCTSSPYLAFKNAFNIAFAVQNTNDAEVIFIHKVIDPDSLKTRDRPSAKILELWVVGITARANQGVLLQRLNCFGGQPFGSERPRGEDSG